MALAGDPPDDSSVPELPLAEDATVTSGPDRGARGEPVTLVEAGGPGTLPDLGLTTVARDTYLVEGEIARGGMGRVLAARDRRLGRPVALKELLSSSPELALRFEREALMTARLQHPSIVNVYEAGRWPSGEPFYAMKRVVGRPLDAVVREAGSLDERVALLPKVLAVVEALAYAHEQGVIHRDLKPANVLVGAFGETVVVDWGLAKDLLREGAFDEGEGKAPVDLAPDGLTMVGSVLGTPAYMAPEQARGERADERADVYSLGAILYTVLAGRPPYVGPSSTAVLQNVLKGPPPPLAERQPGLQEDLLALVRKAMAGGREDRYRTARELAEDLRRFQTGQLVAAHRYSTPQLVRRWVRKHRAPVVIAAVALATMVMLSAASVRRITRERNEARAARGEAESRADELVLSQARMLLDRDPTTALAWLKHYPIDGPAWGIVRTLASDARRRGVAERVLRAHSGGVNTVAFSRDGSFVVSAGIDKLVTIWDTRDGSIRRFEGHTESVESIAISPDRRWIASMGGDGVRLWDRLSGNSRLVGAADAPAEDGALTFSPDGQLLGFTARDATIRLLDFPQGTTRRVLTGEGGPWKELTISPSGLSVAAWGNRNHGCRVWTLAGKEAPQFIPGVMDLAFRSDDTFATGGEDGAINLWEPSTARFRFIGRHSGDREREVRSVSFSPDGRFLASGGRDRAVILWDLASGVRRILGQTSDVPFRVRFAPDGKTVATLDWASGLRVWWPATEGSTRGNSEDKPTVSSVLRGHENKVETFEYSADGSRIVSAGEDGTVRLWALGQNEPGFLNAAPGLFSDVAFSPDGRTVAGAWLERWGTKRASVWLWDSQSRARTQLRGTLTLPWNVHAELDSRAFCFSADGKRLAALSLDGSVLLWHLPSGDLVTLRAHAGSVRVVAFSPDSGLLASAGDDRRVRLWTSDGEPRAELDFQGDRIAHLAFAPDAKTLAVGGSNGNLLLWDIRQGSSRSLSKSPFGIRYLAFSPDGKLLASSHQDGAIRIWDLMTGAFREWHGHELFVRQALFSPDGAHVVSGGMDGTVRIWDVASGRARVLQGHGKNIGEVCFSPDGRRVASAGISDQSARIWDLETGEARALPLEPLHNVYRVQYSPDGKLVYTAATDGVRVWHDDLPTEPAALQRWLNDATDLTMSFLAAPRRDGSGVQAHR